MVEYTEIPDEYREKVGRYSNKEVIKKEFGGDIEKASESHPAFFAYWLIGLKLRDYQIYMLDQMQANKKVMFVCARRLGKTTIMMIFDAWAIFYNKFPTGLDKTTKIIFIAQTDDGSKDYIRDVREIFIAGDSRCELVLSKKKYFTKKFSKKSDSAPSNASQLSLYNSGWNTLRAYPPTQRARGKAASVFHCDEIAFWESYADPDEETVYREVIRPVITDNVNSRLYLATTPNGHTGLSYELMPVDNHPEIFKLIWFPYYVRQDQEYIDGIEEMRDLEYKPQGKMDAFRQEYLAELVVKSDAYFINSEVENVFKDTTLQFYPYSTLPVEVAIDFGGPKNSHTVINVSYLEAGDNIIRLYHKRYDIGKDSTLKEDIIALGLIFTNIQRWHVDSQGGGSSFYGWFSATFGKEMVDEVNFKAEKAGMYRQFKIACYQGRVKTYFDQDLLDEMNGFTRDMKPSKGGTDDMLDSFVMSCRDWLKIEEKAKYNVLTY